MSETAAKPVVLVVEDDDQIAFMMQFVLEQDGFAVERARDRKDAEALIARIDPPALATLDIILPDGSGIDLILVIKEKPGWERVPIVMVTAKPKDKDVNWAIKSGAKAYIVKPFKPEDLRSTVRLVAKRGPVKP